MSVIHIVVPVCKDETFLLESCLHSIKQFTPVDHTVEVVIRGSRNEESIGELVSIAFSVYDRSGLVITEAPDDGYNRSVMMSLEKCDLQYAFVLPASHVLQDKDWFGKMQAPLIRVPGCGMVIAFDDTEPNSLPTHAMPWRLKVKTKAFMVPRVVFTQVTQTPIEWDGDDIANSVRDFLRTKGIECWAAPSCRLFRREAPVR